MTKLDRMMVDKYMGLIEIKVPRREYPEEVRRRKRRSPRDLGTWTGHQGSDVCGPDGWGSPDQVSADGGGQGGQHGRVQGLHGGV